MMSVAKPKSDLVKPTDYGMPSLSVKTSLTPLDMNMPRLYGTRWILCFPMKPTVDKAQVYDELKAGLVRTIHEIPWIGGTVQPEQASDPVLGRIEVSEGEAGVRFDFNDLTSSGVQAPSYDELKTAHFPLSKFSTSQLCPVGVMPLRGVATAAFAAQANFIKGGLLLTICAFHACCDATGLGIVMQTWARMTSSLQCGESLHKVDPSINDRSRLMQGVAGGGIDDFPAYLLAPTPPAVPEKDPDQPQPTWTPRKSMLSRLFRITPSSLLSLKTAIPAYSSSDALHALFWRHLSLARVAAASPPPKRPDTALLLAVNIRSKLDPPLPPSYIGNAVGATLTRRVPFHELAQPEGLATAAAAIRTAVRAWSVPWRMDQLIGMIESRPNPTDYRFAADAILGPDLFSTSWSEVEVYQEPWGSLGKPESFRMPGEAADGAVVVLPRTREGELEFVVALEETALACLMADQEFMKWVQEWA